MRFLTLKERIDFLKEYGVDGELWKLEHQVFGIVKCLREVNLVEWDYLFNPVKSTAQGYIFVEKEYTLEDFINAGYVFNNHKWAVHPKFTWEGLTYRRANTMIKNAVKEIVELYEYELLGKTEEGEYEDD